MASFRMCRPPRSYNTTVCLRTLNPKPEALNPKPRRMKDDNPYVAHVRKEYFPTLGVGLLDVNLNSSPRPEHFSSPRTQSTPRSSLETGVPNSKVFLGCPTPGVPNPRPWSAQPQSVPGVPSPRVSLECPTQPQSLPGVPNPQSAQPQTEYLYQERVGMFEVK